MSPELQIAALVLSLASLILSIISLVLTYNQKNRQDKLSSRKALSDAVAAISAANIEMTKLMTEGQSPEVVNLRRNINAQRSYLANHAEILCREIPDLTRESDYNLIAQAFDGSGNIEKSIEYYKIAINLSASPIQMAVHNRALARLLFSIGQIQSAREKFANALKALSGDDDRSRRERADSLIMWALAERDQGFEEEAVRMRDQAITEAKRIGSKPLRENFIDFINNIWTGGLGKNATSLPVPESIPEPRP